MICAICNREMLLGPSVNEHHLVPKTFGGKETIKIHRICHQKIHSVFTERELKNEYHVVEKIVRHPQMEAFIKWIAKKEPNFYIHNDVVKRQ